MPSASRGGSLDTEVLMVRADLGSPSGYIDLATLHDFQSGIRRVVEASIVFEVDRPVPVGAAPATVVCSVAANPLTEVFGVTREYLASGAAPARGTLGLRRACSVLEFVKETSGPQSDTTSPDGDARARGAAAADERVRQIYERGTSNGRFGQLRLLALDELAGAVDILRVHPSSRTLVTAVVRSRTVETLRADALDLAMGRTRDGQIRELARRLANAETKLAKAELQLRDSEPAPRTTPEPERRRGSQPGRR